MVTPCAPRQAYGLMDEGNSVWHHGYVYLVLINNASQTVCARLTA